MTANNVVSQMSNKLLSDLSSGKMSVNNIGTMIKKNLNVGGLKGPFKRSSPSKSFPAQ